VVTVLRRHIGMEGKKRKGVVRDMGLLIAAPLRFSCHVTGICSKVYATLNRLNFYAFECTRYVINLRRYDHLSVHMNVLLGMPLFVFLVVVFCLFFTDWYIFSGLRRARSSR
jgi:hypothetical protein